MHMPNASSAKLKAMDTEVGGPYHGLGIVTRCIVYAVQGEGETLV